MLLATETASPAVSPLGAARRRGASPARGGAVDTGPYPSVTTSACYADAGLVLGSSFRVGWGPGGKLVFPGVRRNRH